MSNKDQRERTERLCAYLFEELSVEERREVESRLATDVEWQEELERLSRTADWVRDGLGGEDVLSEGAMQALLDEAAQVQPAAGPAPVLRMRSAFLAVAASLAMTAAPAWLVWGPRGGQPDATRTTETLASLEPLQEEWKSLQSETSSPKALHDSGLSERKQVTPTVQSQGGQALLSQPPRAVPKVSNSLTTQAADQTGGSVWYADAIPFQDFLDGRANEPSAGLPPVSTPGLQAESYKGPGDSVPPGGRARRGNDLALLSMRGRDSQPGAKMGYSVLQDGPFLGAEVRKPTQEETEALMALGYLDGESGSNVSALGLKDMAVRGLENSRELVAQPPGSQNPVVRRDYREQRLRTFKDLEALNVPKVTLPDAGPESGAPPLASAQEPQVADDLSLLLPYNSQSELPEAFKGQQVTFDLGRQLIQPRPVAGAKLELNEEAAVEKEVELDADDFFLGLGEAVPEQDTTEQLVTRFVDECRALPGERPRDMFFRFYGDNPFQRTDLDALSTFAADVDTASYRLALKMLSEGILPEKAQIRTEEFVNAIEPDLPAPTESTFGVTLELAPSPYGGREDRWLLRVGVRAQDVDLSQRNPLALTFVVDVSGSMKEERRLELVKHALRMLSLQLDSRDTISVVAFSQEARVVLPPTPATSREVLETAIHSLQPDGGTNAEAGLVLGYELAAANWIEGSHNRVVLLSDGVANIGETDQDRINEDVAKFREQGIYLNTIGVGLANHNDVFLEQLADHGDGICDYVGNAEDVQRAMVERFTGAFVPVAEDVKIQVEFDPTQVVRYRQLGYENRAVADADFRNDSVDAGEVGAGHQVVCLYEIERRSSAQSDAALAIARVRWKAPRANIVGDFSRQSAQEIEARCFPLQASAFFASASPGFQRSAHVAQFAEVLRQSVHALGDSFEALRVRAGKLPTSEEASSWKDFVAALERYAALRPSAPVTSRVDTLRQELQRLELRWQRHSVGEEPMQEAEQSQHLERLEQARQSLREALTQQFERAQR